MPRARSSIQAHGCHAEGSTLIVGIFGFAPFFDFPARILESIAIFVEIEQEVLKLPSSHHAQFRGLAGFMFAQSLRYFIQVQHALSVDGEDEIADLQTAARGKAVGLDLRNSQAIDLNSQGDLERDPRTNY